MNYWLGGRMRYELTLTRPSSGIVFDTFVDRTRAPCVDGRARAYFRVTKSARGEITEGEIVYCRMQIARETTVMHELGHTVGLQHSYGRTDELMTPYYSPFRTTGFSDREGLAMQLLFERPAGNRFPDTDREVSAAGGGVSTTICY